jgi:hypothetical protein
MALSLNRLSTPVQRCVLRKGSRIFGLLGKATPFGVVQYGRVDVSHSWALTAEFGCLRLERLVGDEEVREERLFLPTPSSAEYGVTGAEASSDLVHAVFGLLPAELEQLVAALRRSNFPVLGFSQTDLKCSLSSSTIPAFWPHVVTSNLALYGNVVSLESFARLIIASLPEGQLRARFPNLQPLFKRLIKMLVAQRRGVPYVKELLDLAPAPAPAKPETVKAVD